METERIEMKFDDRAVKRQSMYMGIISAAVLGISIAVYFLLSNLTYLIVFGLVGLAIGGIAVKYLFNLNKTAFVIEDNKVYVKGREYDLSDVAFTVNIVMNGANATPRSLDDLAGGEPVKGLIGDVTVATKDMLYKYTNLKDVLLTFDKIKDVTQEFIILLWRGNNSRRYTRFGGREEELPPEVDDEFADDAETDDDSTEDAATEIKNPEIAGRPDEGDTDATDDKNRN